MYTLDCMTKKFEKYNEILSIEYFFFFLLSNGGVESTLDGKI